MSSLTTQQHFRNRVLSVDQEISSFVPIIGIDKAPDLPLYESLMHAWRSCPKLQVSLTEDDIEVQPPARSVPPPRDASPVTCESLTFERQMIATAARLHFMSLSGPDPHGLDEHQAASIHVCVAAPCCPRCCRGCSCLTRGLSFQVHAGVSLLPHSERVPQRNRPLQAGALQAVRTSPLALPLPSHAPLIPAADS